MKRYRLLKDTYDGMKAGTVFARTNTYYPTYVSLVDGLSVTYYIKIEHVENNPEHFELIPDEPEVKKVERWRPKSHPSIFLGDTYFCILQDGDITDIDTEVDNDEYEHGNVFNTYELAQRVSDRISIYMRLSALSEEVEEGSTELKGGWHIYRSWNTISTSYDSGYLDTTRKSDMRDGIEMSRIATFSSDDLCKLFIDSAGPDIWLWFGLQPPSN